MEIFSRIVLLYFHASEPGYILGYSSDLYAASNPSETWEWVFTLVFLKSCYLHSSGSDLYFTPLLTCRSVLSCCLSSVTFINTEICHVSSCIIGTVDGSCEDSVYYFQYLIFFMNTNKRTSVFSHLFVGTPVCISAVLWRTRIMNFWL